MMTLDEIKKILDMVRQHELAEFELEQEGVKLRVRKDGVPQLVHAPIAAVALPAAEPVAGPVPVGPQPVAPPATSPSEPTDGADDAMEFAVVTSPIVGTFYRSPDPESAPFAEIGQVVRKGQVLCVIEAMKLMNEILSEYEGEVVKVYIENGQPVQYGERLFAIRAR
jgi:acetyl-CoA carboxylase biotin carboxyl carrier protein